MIDKRHAGNEIGRLIGLNYFPSDQKAVKELVTALSFARSEVIATAVINEWLEGASERPTPADIRRLVAVHNEAAEQRDKAETQAATVHYNCRTCHDEGFYGGYLAGRFAGPWKWCDCAAGARERQRHPELVEEANANRIKLLTIFKEKTGPGGLKSFASAMADEYNGEF